MKRRLQLEMLESRLVPSTYEWVGNGLYWNTWYAQPWELQTPSSATGWAPTHNVPGPGDTVEFNAGSGNCYLNANEQCAQLILEPSFTGELCTMGGPYQATLTVGVSSGQPAPAPSSIACGTFANDGFLVLQNTTLDWSGGSITADPAQFYGLSQLGTINVGASAALNISGSPGQLGSNVAVEGTMTLAAMTSNLTMSSAANIDVAQGGSLNFANATLGAGGAGGIAATGLVGVIANFGTITDTATDSTATATWQTASGGPAPDFLREDMPISNYATVSLTSSLPMQVAGNQLAGGLGFANRSNASTLQLGAGSDLEVGGFFQQDGGAVVVPTAGATASLSSLNNSAVYFAGGLISATGNLDVAAAGDVQILDTDLLEMVGRNTVGSLTVTCPGALDTGGYTSQGGFLITLVDVLPAAEQPSTPATFTAFTVNAGGGWQPNVGVDVLSPNFVWGGEWNSNETNLNWVA